MNPSPSAPAPIDTTAARAAEFVSAHTESATSTKSGETEFLQRLASFRRVRRSRKRFMVGATIASTLVVAGLVGSRFVQRPGDTVLSYQVDRRDPPSRGTMLGAQAADSLLTFSDGSRIRMAAQSRGRVMEVSERGAKFSLEDGKVSVDIVPRPRARWVLQAGPFRVLVHGTSFTVAWNPVGAVFDVHLTSGAISVVSPIAGPDIHLREGQSLRVSLREQAATIEAIAPPVPPATGTTPSTSFEPSRAASPLPSDAPRWSHRRWMAALSGDKAADIVAEADRHGLTTVMERADSDDLWALANAARYVGRYPLASQALSVQRRRFPSSERAREAAFLLGRLHESDPDGPRKALGWYDRYLVEAHEGADVSDALGRKMTLLQRWNRNTEALAVARDYLRRFPAGTYANAARALLRSSTAQQ